MATKIRALPAAAVATLCFLANSVSAQTEDARAVRQVTEQPVRFEANRGQADPRVRYVSRARDYTVALTDDEALLLVRKPASSARMSRLEASDLALVRMRLAGASRTPRITASGPLPGNVYYAGAGAPAPLTPIDSFARVAYAGVYPGIDLVYYGDDHQLEFDFHVAPFADPKQIALSLEGADGMTLTDAGDLSMRVGGAEVRLEKPLVYQERDGDRIEVAGAYVLPADDTHTVRFRLGSYDPSLPLVIDPTWMTVFGSTNEDWMSGFAVDSAGHPRLLGETFDPATFPFTQVELGLLTPPNCFFTKLDGATGLTTYTILFGNTQRCEALALAPNDVAYFAGFVYPNGLQNNQGTTVTAVDDSSGVPVVSRFGVSNYDSTAPGEGIDALAVNSLGHVFLLGPCRIVAPGTPPLQLSGYNETPDPARPFIAEGCTPPTPGTSEKYQPLLTVVDNRGTFLYGSFLSPREEVTRYGLAADEADRAYIVGGQVEPFTVLATADAYRESCPTGGSVSEMCAYLMVLDTTTVGKDSLVYASYLWNTQNVETVAVRLGPAGAVYIASEGRVYDDFPSNRPTNPSSWPYSLYPALREGVQLARFNRDANGLPSQFDFATVFDPSRGVVALNGHTVRDALADLRLFSSGAPAVASVAYTASLAPMGIVTTFDTSGDRVGEVWTQNLGARTPVGFGVGTGSGGSLFLAGQIEQVGAQDSDVFVERIDALDPSANRPPTVFIFENVTTVYADSPTAGALLQINAIAADPDGDPLTYSWTGPFTDNPVTTNNYLIARVPLGTQQTVTVTVNDGHGNVASASRTFDVVGTPFVGTTATPVDSDMNGLVYNYAPITITATGIGAGGGNAYLHTRLDQNPPIPAHLQAGSPPIYFDLSTDAVLIAPIALCVDTRGMSFANPANIRLYQYQQSGPLASWVDITSAGYPQGNQLCGQSDRLGTFAIFYPQVPATAVQTIAGNGTREGSNDGIGGNPIDDFQDGPATFTALPYLFGGAYDRANNQLFVSGGDDIMRLNLNTNTIARVAGNGVGVLGSIDGPGGDPRDDLVEGGDAFNTYVGFPAELAIAPNGDVVFFDRNTCLVRRLDAQGRLWAVAGNGACGFSGDGSSAALASLSYGQMAYDTAGNLFLADNTNARVRRIDAITNVVDTVAGNGTYDIPVTGASARSAIGLPAGIAFDSQGHLLIAGGMHLLRISTGAGDALIDGDADEVISVIGGCNTNCMLPFNGDGVEVSHPQVYLPGLRHLTVAQDGAVIFQDYFRIRRIAPGADGIVTGAGDDIISTIAGYYDWATISQIPNFNGDTFATQALFGGVMFVVDDGRGGIIVVDGNNFRVRRFGLPPVGASPVTINTLTVPAAIEGTPYSATITAAGGTGASYTWSIAAGALPAGLTLAQAGTPSTTISGTPTEDGTFDFTVRVTDTAGGTGTRAFTLIVDASLSPIQINVTETIAVTDGPALLPSAMIGLTEQIVVADVPVVIPPVVIGVIERIIVNDAPGVLQSVMIGITEEISVTDAPRLVDNVPPVVNLPAGMVAEAQTPSGAVVTFLASATDNAPGLVQVACSPQSGSVFAFNGSSPTTTIVTCTATDVAGNVATGSFNVVVHDTTAPQVQTAQLVIAATEATGARGNVPQAPHTPLLQQLPLLAGAVDAGDANPARLPAQWVVCGNPAQVLGPIADTTLYPVGMNCFFYAFRDASGNVGTGIGTIEVSPPIGGHINVPNVAVTATDLNNVPLPVTATFLGLDQPGLLTAVPPQFIPPPPAGMIFAGAPLELRSTALTQAPAIVCMRPPVGDVAERLLALEFFQWVDRTESTGATGEVCSRPGELGTFALVRRDLSGFTMTMTPVSAVRQAGFGHRVFIDVSDNSDPTTRVMLQSRFEGSAEFLHPQVPNSPLSVTVQRNAQGVFSHVTVSLGTGPNGELISTARQVADSIHAHAGFGPVFAWTSENTNGEGIVAPKPLTPFTRLQVSTTSPGVNTSGLDISCYVTLPALCVADLDPATLPFAPFTLAITPYLDLNRNLVADAGELTAHGEVTWVDVTPPFLHIPANINVPAASPAGTAVSFTVPAFDNIDRGELPTSCSPASGATFPIGTTTVACTATDSSGNVGSGSFTVTVNAPPGQTPSLSLPGNLTVAATSPSGAVVTYEATAWASAFGGSFQIAAFCTPFSGSTFPVGTTTVTCTATNPFAPPPLSFPATGSFTVTVLPFVPPPPVLASLTPSTALAGSADLVITIAGSGFDTGATAFWNGAPRPAVVNSATELTVSIFAADLATTADLTTAQITVNNPGSPASNPLAFVITGPQVLTVDAEVALAGALAIASNAPTLPAQHGVTATLINHNPSSPPATVAVASYGTNPVGDGLFAAGGFFDVQVTGADPSDSLTAQFYYANTVVGAAEMSLRLRYWNGSAWLLVIGSGGAVPLKNPTDNLDGTISGGRFTVTLDGSSIPAITDLGGTVFALVEDEDRVAPVTTLEQSPAPNAQGWNNTDVAVTLAATDNLTGVARTEFAVNGGAWQTYQEPIVLRHSGIYDLRYRSVDGEGNVELTKTTRVRIDKSEPLAIVVALPTLLIPADRRMVDVSVLPLALDLLSGVDGITLVSVTSNDPGMTSDDVTGWSIGTKDYRGKLRAERTASGNRRIYTLTYRVTDRAGNETLATALVVVPGVRD